MRAVALLAWIGLFLGPVVAENEKQHAPPSTQTSPKPPSSLEGLFKAAQRDPNQIVPLLVAASARLSEQPTAESHALAERLRPFLKRAFGSPEIYPEMARIGLAEHRIKAGDLPTRIAARYHIAASLLGKLNRKYDARRLRPGDRLKVIDLRDASLRLVIDRTHFRLAVWHTVKGKRILTGYYPIAVGAANSPTPKGNTTITSHVKDPSWRDPKTKQIYGPKHKKNVLGGYWLGLSSKGLGKKGIGIHGYSGAPASHWIGRRASHGCVRLLQADIDQVFGLVSVGTRVSIH